MKNNFSRVLALAVLPCLSLPVWAQPNIAPPAAALPQPKEGDFDRADNNAEALALIGAFHNKLARAGTYRGHLVVTTTMALKGTTKYEKINEMKSSWIGDKEIPGAFKKDVSHFVTTTTRNGKSIVEKFRSVDDGVKSYRFNETKNIWSEREQDEGETTWMFDQASGIWSIALVMFGAGREFEEFETVDGQDQIVLKSEPEDEYVFDAKSGDLVSHTRTVSVEGREDEVTKVKSHWLQHEFDVPLADSLFEWKTPVGATKVDPEKMDFGYYLAPD